MQIDMGVKDIVGYMKGREEVSAVYLYGRRMGLNTPERGAGIGVLLKEGHCNAAKGANCYCFGAMSSVPDVEILCLNAAPSHLKHHVVRKGSVVFERGDYRPRFAASAINEYLDAPAGGAYGDLAPDDTAEIIEGVLYKGVDG